jgi:hypothetical protein
MTVVVISDYTQISIPFVSVQCLTSRIHSLPHGMATRKPRVAGLGMSSERVGLGESGALAAIFGPDHALRSKVDATVSMGILRTCFRLPLANFRHAEEDRSLKPDQPSEEEANADLGFWASREEQPVGWLHP